MSRILLLAVCTGVLGTSCASKRRPPESIVSFGRFAGVFDGVAELQAAHASEARVFLFAGQEVPNIPGWTGAMLTVLPLSEQGRRREAQILEGVGQWRLVVRSGARCSEHLRGRFVADHAKLIPGVTEGLRPIHGWSFLSVDQGQVRCYVLSPDGLHRMPDDGRLAVAPTLPDVDALARVTVSDSSGRTIFMTDDDARLVDVLRWLESLDDGWVPAWDSMPSPDYTMTVEAKNGAKVVVWFGDGWIGTGRILRHLHTPERARVGDLLGLPVRRAEAPRR